MKSGNPPKSKNRRHQFKSKLPDSLSTNHEMGKEQKHSEEAKANNLHTVFRGKWHWRILMNLTHTHTKQKKKKRRNEKIRTPLRVDLVGGDGSIAKDVECVVESEYVKDRDREQRSNWSEEEEGTWDTSPWSQGQWEKQTHHLFDRSEMMKICRSNTPNLSWLNWLKILDFAFLVPKVGQFWFFNF